MSENEYKSEKDAQKAGWCSYIPKNKTILHYNRVSIKCRDISDYERDGYDFGGKFAIKALGQEFARSQEIWVNGRFSQRFKRDDVKAALKRAKKTIDEHQKTQGLRKVVQLRPAKFNC